MSRTPRLHRKLHRLANDIRHEIVCLWEAGANGLVAHWHPVPAPVRSTTPRRPRRPRRDA